MSIENVREFFAKNAPEINVIELDVITHTVQMAADGLGVRPEEIAKSIALRANDEPMLLVTSGIKKLDNAKFKALFGIKPRMLELEETMKLTGHPIGGVTPIALASEMKVFLDISLKEFDFIYPAAGSNNSAFKISPDKLAQLTSAQWVDVCK